MRAPDGFPRRLLDLTVRPLRWIAIAAAVTASVSCGKIGPPLPPLRLVPDAPATLVATRVGQDVHLRFVVPAQNAGAQGLVDVERVEIYAASVAAGAPAPPNREFLTKAYLVGSVDVRPAEIPGEPAPAPAAAAAETRPGPGEAATFVEPLTTQMLNPVAPPAVPAPPTDPAAKPAAAAPAAPTYATRIYAVRGVTSRGRPGNPSGRVTVPLVEPPAAPAGVAAEFTETAFVLSWTPPLADVGGAPLLFNVYRAEAPAAPLNAKPAATPPVELPGVEFGVERCFVVRTLQQVAKVGIESEASAPVCVTPRDIFPPAAPSGLTGVATPGGISLIWDAGTETDLGGYLVLRTEAGGDTLQPLTPEPIRETSYTDTAVTPGVRYAYVIVAVDRATPPNRSAPSARHEVTASQ